MDRRWVKNLSVTPSSSLTYELCKPWMNSLIYLSLSLLIIQIGVIIVAVFRSNVIMCEVG